MPHGQLTASKHWRQKVTEAADHKLAKSPTMASSVLICQLTSDRRACQIPFMTSCIARIQLKTNKSDSKNKRNRNITNDSSGFFRIPTMRTASWVRVCDVLRGSDVIDCGKMVSPVISGYASGGTTSKFLLATSSCVSISAWVNVHS